MKRIMLLIVVVLFGAICFTGCQQTVWTYDNVGEITINILNEEISGKDIEVVTSLKSEVQKNKKSISIKQEQLLKNSISLTIDGYISKNIIVNSIDFDNKGEFSVDVKFEESYIFLELTLITEAPRDTIKFESDNILSQSSHGNIYEFQLSKSGIPHLEISAGKDFQVQSFSLTQEEINKGISARTIMLLTNDYTMVAFGFDSYYEIDAQYEDYGMMDYVQRHRKGNQIIFAVQKNNNINFTIRTDDGQYVGEKRVTSLMLEATNLISIGIEDLDIAVHLEIIPYDLESAEFWAVLAEKVNGEFVLLTSTREWNVCNIYYTFSTNKEYYVFAMNGDGKVRYKKIELGDVIKNEYGGKSLEVVFEQSDTVKEIMLEIIDITSQNEDFSGVSVMTNVSEDIGVIDSGNSLNIQAEEAYLDLQLWGFSDGYEMIDIDVSYSEEHYSRLISQGKFTVYVYRPFKLTIHIDYKEDLDGYYVEYLTENNDNIRAYVGDNNTVIIEEFKFQYYYSLTDGGSSNIYDFAYKVQDIKIADLIVEEEGHLSINLKVENYN